MIDEAGKRTLLKAIRDRIRGCRKCSIREDYDKPVPFAGSPNARVMFIGEAPGSEEVERGKPFAGKSGQLLRSAIEKAELDGDDLFITNTILCRPLDNKFPDDPEIIVNCQAWLRHQVRVIRPSVVVAVGGKAHKLVFDQREGITKACGNWSEMKWPWEEDLPSFWYMPVLHPSFCFRGADGRYDNPVMNMNSQERCALLEKHIASIPERFVVEEESEEKEEAPPPAATKFERKKLRF